MYQQIRRQGKRRKAKKVAGLIRGRVDIGQRPKAVDAKSRIVALEVDLIIPKR